MGAEDRRRPAAGVQREPPWFREERGHDQVFLVVINVDVPAGSLCSLKIQILLCLRGVDMSRLIWIQLSSWGPLP